MLLTGAILSLGTLGLLSLNSGYERMRFSFMGIPTPDFNGTCLLLLLAYFAINYYFFLDLYLESKGLARVKKGE